MSDYCCDKFKSASTATESTHCPYGINRHRDGTYSIDSCCGGCAAALDMTFCPWCGSPISNIQKNDFSSTGDPIVATPTLSTLHQP